MARSRLQPRTQASHVRRLSCVAAAVPGSATSAPKPHPSPGALKLSKVQSQEVPSAFQLSEVQARLARLAEVEARTAALKAELQRQLLRGSPSAKELPVNAMVVSELWESALHSASERGNAEQCASLLALGAKINHLQEDVTPLFRAATCGHEAVVRLLLDKGADVNATIKRMGPLTLVETLNAGHPQITMLLIKHGASTSSFLYNYQDGVAQNGSPLTVAAKKGYMDVVTALLNRGVDVNDHVLATTPLMEAAEAGNRDVVELLLERGADVNWRAPSFDVGGSHSALEKVAAAGKEDMVEFLLANGANTDTAYDGEYRTTALHCAAREGRLCAANILLTHDADVNAADEVQETPLCDAVRGGHLDVAALLLENGAFADGCVKECLVTPLALAATSGREDVVKLLLRYGALVKEPASTFVADDDDDDYEDDDVEEDDDHDDEDDDVVEDSDCEDDDEAEYYRKISLTKRSPLLAAVLEGHHSIVELLLDHGADVNEVNAAGHTALHVFAGGHCWYPDMVGMLELLMSRGAKAKPSADCRLLWTPVHEAADYNQATMLDLLLQHGLEVDPVIWRKDVVELAGSPTAPLRDIVIDKLVTPLMVAIEGKCYDAFDTLLRHGANVDVFRGYPVYSPLCAAARLGRLRFVAQLLDKGASVDGPDEAGRTPLYWATICQQRAAVKLLLSHGASPTRAARDGSTPLSKALECGKHDSVKLLQRASATPA